jgi:streptogramin lyase
MITFKSLLQRFAFALLALLWIKAPVHAQISVQSGAQNAWNYTGTFAVYPTPSAEHRCVVATFDGVYVGAYNFNTGYWNIEKYDNAGAFVMRFPKNFSYITGLAANVSGDTIYGFDGALGMGFAFSPTGAQKFQFGSGTGSNAPGYFNGTYDGAVYHAIAVNSQGKIYAVDKNNYRIQIFNQNGTYSGSFGSNGTLPGQFSNVPANIAVGPNDEVFVIDWNQTLTKFSPTGEFIAKAPSTDFYWWNRTFTVSRDGQLMVGIYANEPWAILVDTNTMKSDKWSADQFIDSSRAGAAYFHNAFSRNNSAGCEGAAFDPAGNLWVTSYNSVTPNAYSLERFERRMRFDNYKPTKPDLLPSIVSALQQPGGQTVDISYKVDTGALTGGILSGGSMVLSGGSLSNGTLVGGTLTGGVLLPGTIQSGTVTTALIGWLNGVKNWSHLVVPSVNSGTLAPSGAYFWSDMYDPATRIDSRPPVSDNIQQAAVDGLGNVYVTTDYCVRKIAPSGEASLFAGGVWSSGYTDAVGATARFGDPRGICADSQGNVYVADVSGRVIRKINSAGVVSTLAGSWGGYDRIDGIGSSARFRSPLYLACDANDNIYVSESNTGYGGYIRKVTSSGSVTTVASSIDPRGIAVDAAGTIYAADYNGHKILKIVPDGTSTGVKTTFAGSGSASHVDGTGISASFYYPLGLTIDGSGNLFVTENDNVVRKITPAGVVTTIGQTNSYVNNICADSVGNLYVAETSTQQGIGRMVRKGAPSVSSSAGIIAAEGVLGAGIQTGTVNTVSWDVAKDLPGLNFANLSFEVLAKDDRPEIGAHFVTIPGDAFSNSDLNVSNNPVSEASLSDLWAWLLANRDPRIAISGNTVIFTQAGLDYVADATHIYDASDSDKTTKVVHTGGTGGADGGWSYTSSYWGTTTNRGRAFACKLLNYRPITASELTRANSGRFNLPTPATHFSVVNLNP